jgi:glycopeptide antibiotics resistance protein
MSSLQSGLKDIIFMTWPTLFISLVVLVSIRITYLIKHKERFILYKEILFLLFVLYILCLFQVVTAQDINSLDGNNLIPFKEIFRYKFGSHYFIKNIIGNVIMFAPYGFFVGKYASLKNFKLTILLLILASFSIEVTQLIIGRVFDVDDIILNVFGGALGYIAYRFIDNIFNRLPKILRSEWVLNILSILLLVFSGFIIMKVVM